jgi:palmitoyl-protein thioesterase
MKFVLPISLIAVTSASTCSKDVPTCFSSLDHVPASPSPSVNDNSVGDASYIPTVFMHGLGDSGSNRGMKNLAKTVSDTYPGAYSVAVDVANGMSSYTSSLESQVDDFAKTVSADSNLAKGFNAVGLSQGGLIVRAYVEKYNNPPVHNLLSLCGPQGGVGDCPGGTPSWMCNIGKSVMYGAGFSFSGYWKDTDGDASDTKAKYLEKSPYLADINNDRDAKNQQYVDNMLSVNKYVLVEALNDTVVAPHTSEQHGFFDWGSIDTVHSMEDDEGYQGDFIGLKTMNEVKKNVDWFTYEGDHLRWSDEFWTETILPYLGDTF